MENLDFKIFSLKKELENYKEKRKLLVESIKKYILHDLNKSFISSKDVFNASLFYFFQKIPYNYYDSYFSLRNWDDKKYYCSYIEQYKDYWGTTSPIYVGYIVDIFECLEYKLMWIKKVQEHSYTSSLDCYKEFVKSLKEQELIQEIQDFYGERFELITIPELKIKKVFVLLPNK